MFGLKKLISRIQSDKDEKALFANFSYLMLLRISGYLFPLITIPYLARVIGVDGFGKIAFAAAVVLWFKTITDWGFNYTATRDVAKNRENKELVSFIFTNVLWAKFLLMLISLFIFYILINTIPVLEKNKTILLLTFFTILGEVIFPEWLFQAMEKMKYITIFNLVARLIFTLLVFIFITKPEDYILNPVFTGLGSVICGAVSLYIIIFKWNISLRKPSLKYIFSTIKKSTNVFINNVMPNLYYGFSTILVGYFIGTNANGILDAGRRFITIALSFTNVLSRAFYPFLARKGYRHDMYKKINLTASMLLFSAIFLLAPYIIKIFYTEQFYPAINVLRISSFSILFLSLRDIYGINFLLLRGYDKEARNITIVTSIIGFLLAIPLVYYYSYTGAAMVAVAVHLTQGLLMARKSKSLSK